MIPIEKVVCGGQDGADIAGASFARKHKIPLNINICRNFKPVNRRAIPDDIMGYATVEVVTSKDGIPGLIERTKYNVIHSDFTIILLDRHIFKTKGSKLTMDYCYKHDKPFFIYNLNDLSYGECVFTLRNASYFWKVITVKINCGGKFTMNIAGPRNLDEKLGIEALEKLFFGGGK